MLAFCRVRDTHALKLLDAPIAHNETPRFFLFFGDRIRDEMASLRIVGCRGREK